MGSSKKFAREIQPEKSRDNISAVGNRPIRTLVAISQAVAAETKTSLSESPTISWALAESRESSKSHHK